MYYRYGSDSKGNLVKKAVVYTKDEHLIPHNKIDQDALQIINRLKDMGFTSYIVGGAVRDLIVGNVPKDFDIVTNATPSKIKRIFRNSRIIGRRFRLVHVIFGTKVFEVSTFRSNAEGSVGNDFGTIEQDVLRRDFTINALYYDPLQELVIDYVNGMRDIKKHQIRPVISLDTIFIEDPVRMLRAIKYSATTNSKMSHSLKHKIRANANLLSQISPSRLTEELLKIINSPYAFEIVKEALDSDLFMYLQPAATNLIYDSRDFEKKYLESINQLAKLNQSEAEKTEKSVRLGQKLTFLIKDFIETLTNWPEETKEKQSASELYSRTWAQCRNFILPMNPVRKELEFAVKSVLISLGVNMKIKEPKEKLEKSEKSTKKSRQKKSSAEKPAKSESTLS